jgi:hypothetical protein
MIKFDAGTLTATIVNIRKLGVTERAAAIAGAKAAGDELRFRVRQNISLRDHSLEDLRVKHDHPYAKRHGSIKIHQSGSKSLLHPQNRVHSQSQAMLSALQSQLKTESGGYRYSVWIDTAIAPHAEYVVGVQPTSIMIPRDVLWDTAQAPFVTEKMMRKITDKLGRAMRSQATLRFKR